MHNLLTNSCLVTVDNGTPARGKQYVYSQHHIHVLYVALKRTKTSSKVAVIVVVDGCLHVYGTKPPCTVSSCMYHIDNTRHNNKSKNTPTTDNGCIMKAHESQCDSLTCVPMRAAGKSTHNKKLTTRLSREYNTPLQTAHALAGNPM